MYVNQHEKHKMNKFSIIIIVWFNSSSSKGSCSGPSRCYNIVLVSCLLLNEQHTKIFDFFRVQLPMKWTIIHIILWTYLYVWLILAVCIRTDAHATHYLHRVWGTVSNVVTRAFSEGSLNRKSVCETEIPHTL